MCSDLQIDGWAYISWALLLLFVPVDWLFSAVLAAVCHECAHLLMLCILNVRVRGAVIHFAGAEILTDAMDDWQELLCSLAGPVGSFALVILCRWLPKTSVCAAVQGCFNLLPIYPLDGGRSLRCCGRILMPHWWGRWGRQFETATKAAIYALLAAAAWHFEMERLVFYAVGLLACRWMLRKKPCKASCFAVQ